MKRAACVLCLLAPAAAQVRVWNALPARAAAAAERLLHQACGGALRLQPANSSDLDLVVGLDAVECEARIASGELTPADFAQPWSVEWTLAIDTDQLADEQAPRDWEDLLSPSLTRRLLAPAAGDAPGLWAWWMRADLRKGNDERHAFAWLRTIDARVFGYQSDAAAALRALRAGDVAVAVVPVHALADATDRSTARADPSSGLARQPLGLVLVARPGAPAAARAAFELLRGEDGRRLVAGEGDLSLVPTGLDLKGAVAWRRQWQSDVVGEGRRLEDWTSLLDVLFAIGFFCFLVYVFRRTRPGHG
jgi:hypothetical protein